MNQIFYYICSIKLSEVTSLRDPCPRHCARTALLLTKKMLQRWRADGNTESNLIAPRFESQTSCFTNDCVTTRLMDGNITITVLTWGHQSSVGVLDITSLLLFYFAGLLASTKFRIVKALHQSCGCVCRIAFFCVCTNIK